MRNILKAAGIDPCPKRASATWDEFVARHATSLWQCDFFSQKVLTITGIREVFVLAFLHVETRRVILSPATLHPNEAWAASQAATIVEQARSQGLGMRYVQRDRDGKYAGIDAALKQKRVKALKRAVRTPNARAFVERFIGTVRRECLNHFLFFGTQHLDSVLKTWLSFYHKHRPHQGKENELLTGNLRITNSESAAIAETISLSDIRCEQQGLLKSYHRKAA
ncbi:integrase core domain-containing protein [Anatilimnocola sp. NA78]|uniref:integrase core domain-containing protein n=1 Tax=Anatilimnocola sp. NA78 TaxID=3415683 RepID=UPI003CE44AB0